MGREGTSRNGLDGVGGAVGSMVIYLLMAGVLLLRPRGLFGAGT
jgi:branched-subunit amino acid ABC-type transport system permease component